MRFFQFVKSAKSVHAQLIVHFLVCWKGTLKIIIFSSFQVHLTHKDNLKGFKQRLKMTKRPHRQNKVQAFYH